jgi:hypothetical protein
MRGLKEEFDESIKKRHTSEIFILAIDNSDDFKFYFRVLREGGLQRGERDQPRVELKTSLISAENQI